MKKNTQIFVVSLLFVACSGLIYADEKPMTSTPKQESKKSVHMAFPTKCACIDPQQIITASDEWRDLVTQTQKEFQVKFEDIRKQKEAFDKARSEAKPADMKNLAKQQKDLEIEQKALEIELQQKQQELQMKMMQKIDEAVSAVAKKQGWDAVMPKFFFVSDNADITGDVIKNLNSTYKTTKAKSKFKK